MPRLLALFEWPGPATEDSLGVIEIYAAALSQQ